MDKQRLDVANMIPFERTFAIQSHGNKNKSSVLIKSTQYITVVRHITKTLQNQTSKRSNLECLLLKNLFFVWSSVWFSVWFTVWFTAYFLSKASSICRKNHEPEIEKKKE